jgi:hypothetical protein
MKKAFNSLGISGAAVGEALVREAGMAHRDSDPQTIQQLLECGTFVTIPYDYLDKALRQAARHERPNIAKLLIAYGAQVNARDEHGGTALSIAACGKSAETVKLLIENVANVNACDDTGRTPLMMAAAWGVPDTVDALLKAGADLSSKDNHRLTAFDWADIRRKQENAGILKSFVAAPATPARPKQPNFIMSSGR